jgi:L-asparagine oxygenase
MRRQLAATGRYEFLTRSATELVEFAASRGNPVAITPKARIIDTLTVMHDRDAPRHSLSAIHGTAGFPLHTDAAHRRHPPRWIVLRCVDPGCDDRPTLIADAHQLDLIGARLSETRRAVWSVRTGVRSFLASALFPRTRRERVSGLADLGLRYDLGCMRPADPAFVAAATLLAEGIDRLPHDAISWEPGLTMVLDNWRMLHGRSAGTDGNVSVRRLERVAIDGGVE